MFFTKNIDKEISQQTKLYFADTGLLNVLAGQQLSSGQVFENAIAIQLKNQGTIQYHQKKTGQEIDFILNEEIGLDKLFSEPEQATEPKEKSESTLSESESESRGLASEAGRGNGNGDEVKTSENPSTQNKPQDINIPDRKDKVYESLSPTEKEFFNS